jgi:flagellar hook-associated protein 2
LPVTFVSAYNSVMNFIEDKTKVTGKGKDAVVGALHGMQDVTALQRQMRSTLSQAVSGISGGPSTLAGIGLGTTGQSATISLDTTKLNSALTNYAGNVQEILADTTNGVMVKLSSFIDSQTLYGNGPLAQKADRLEPSVKRADKSITRFNERLELMEARLTKQFAAMEKAMSQLQQGVGSLFSQLGVSQ